MATKKNIFAASQAARNDEQKAIKENNGIKEEKPEKPAEKQKKESAYTSTITLSIMPEDHKKLKMLSVETGKKMNVLLHDMITNYKA